MQLSRIIRTIRIDFSYLSISVICCDLDMHMLHHSFSDTAELGEILQLTRRRSTASHQVVPTSLPTGSPSANSRSLLTRGMCVLGWGQRLKRRHVRNDVWPCRDYLCLQDACKCSNFLCLWFTAEMEAAGLSGLLVKYETTHSLRLPAALYLLTQWRLQST